MFAVPFILLLAVLGLGGLAAVVFGIVYAIVNKRPGVALASVLVPMALLFGIALLMFFSVRANVVNYSTGPAQVNWAAGPSLSPMPSMPPFPAMPTIPHVSVVPNWLRLTVLILIVVGLAKLFRKRSSCDGKRGGWSWALVVVAILAMVYFMNIRRQFASVAQHEANVQLRVAQQIHAQVEADPGAQQAVDEVAQRYGGLNQQSMQAIWERLNQPRIKLDSVQHDAKLATGDGAKQIAVVAAEKDEAQPMTPISDKSPESLTRSLARLERMVEQVSAVADQLSDAGTLIGKGMIALSDTAASRTRAQSGESAATDEAAEETWPAVAAAPAVHTTVADAMVPVQQTIEIEFDQQKLNQFNLSYGKIKDMLGHDGLWRGAAVRFIPNESRIVVTGNVEDDYVSRLSGTLVSTVGRQRRPVHLSDVATITTSAERIARDAANSDRAESERPAWVDEPPKNIGNIRRQVIVAGDFVTVDECNREADRQLYVATLNHLKELYGDADLERIPDSVIKHIDGSLEPSPAEFAAGTLNRMGIGIDFIRREIAKKEYVETVERSVGPMKTLYVQVEFSPSIDAELRQRWDEVRRQTRFAVVGVGAGSVLGLMGLVFGLLKVDTWTKGYYTKRLFFGVPAAIIGLIGLLAMLGA